MTFRTDREERLSEQIEKVEQEIAELKSQKQDLLQPDEFYASRDRLALLERQLQTLQNRKRQR